MKTNDHLFLNIPLSLFPSDDFADVAAPGSIVYIDDKECSSNHSVDLRELVTKDQGPSPHEIRQNQQYNRNNRSRDGTGRSEYNLLSPDMMNTEIFGDSNMDDIWENYDDDEDDENENDHRSSESESESERQGQGVTPPRARGGLSLPEQYHTESEFQAAEAEYDKKIDEDYTIAYKIKVNEARDELCSLIELDNDAMERVRVVRTHMCISLQSYG